MGYTQENQHVTQKWRFGRWLSCSNGWFLGSFSEVYPKCLNHMNHPTSFGRLDPLWKGMDPYTTCNLNPTKQDPNNRIESNAVFLFENKNHVHPIKIHTSPLLTMIIGIAIVITLTSLNVLTSWYSGTECSIIIPDITWSLHSSNLPVNRSIIIFWFHPHLCHITLFKRAISWIKQHHSPRGRATNSAAREAPLRGKNFSILHLRQSGRRIILVK